MNKKIVITIVAVLVIAAVILGLSKGSNDNSNSQGGSQNKPSQQTSSQSNNPAIESNSVTINNFAFSPSNITVKKGETVTWTNKDTVPHTVIENDSQPGPSSNTLNSGEKYSFTFTAAGTFQYHCSIHPDMKGTVVVTE